MHVEYNASLRMNNDHKLIPTRLCLIIDCQGEFFYDGSFSQREREREKESIGTKSNTSHRILKRIKSKNNFIALS